jgi:mRNA-degrading endonuclease RelE of RelBE toxin-antitoxin system
MPARFSLIFPPGFRRDLEDLPSRVHDEVLEAVKMLGVSPKGPHSKIKKLNAKGIGGYHCHFARSSNFMKFRLGLCAVRTDSR